MSKHTPGPWTFGHWGNDFWIGPDKSGLTGKVAKVFWGMGEAVAEGRAHARLIAAAPDMLLALKAVVASVDKNNGEMVRNAVENGWAPGADKVIVNPDPVISACRAIIAHAENEHD